MPCAKEPLISEREVEVESGLGGRLGLPFGGSGKPPILVVLRRVLLGVGRPEDSVADGGESAEVATIVLRVGTAGDERDLLALGAGRPDVVTDLVRTFGVGVADDESPTAGLSGKGFLVLYTGSAGKGPFGGASGEVDGRRAVVVEVMVAVADTDMLHCKIPSAPAQIQFFVRRSVGWSHRDMLSSLTPDTAILLAIADVLQVGLSLQVSVVTSCQVTQSILLRSRDRPNTRCHWPGRYVEYRVCSSRLLK